jgi:hypothetical protein
MAAGVTYDAIATTTLSSSSSNVSFTSIPSTYTDLILVSSLKVTVVATGGRFRFNGDTGSNYNSSIISGTGSVVGHDAYNTTFGYLAFYGPPDDTNFSTNILQIAQYKNTNMLKTTFGRSNRGYVGVSGISITWASTSAITTIDVFPEANQWAIGSTFTLYGIAAA